jgi:hypothetical protein
MLPQENVNLFLQIYQSRHVLFAQCLTYCVKDLESEQIFEDRN